MYSAHRLRQAVALLEEAIARDPALRPRPRLAAQCCQHLATGFNAPDRDAIRPKGIDFGRRAIEAAGDDLQFWPTPQWRLPFSAKTSMR